MNIAVVGGGTRCCRLLDLIERHTFQEISPKVVAVADNKDHAPGLVKARKATKLYTVATPHAQGKDNPVHLP